MCECRSSHCTWEGRSLSKFDGIDVVVVRLIGVTHRGCPPRRQVVGMPLFVRVPRHGDDDIVEAVFASFQLKSGSRGQRNTSSIIQVVAIRGITESRTACYARQCCCWVDDGAIALGQVDAGIGGGLTDCRLEGRRCMRQVKRQIGCRRSQSLADGFTPSITTILQQGMRVLLVDIYRIGHGTEVIGQRRLVVLVELTYKPDALFGHLAHGHVLGCKDNRCRPVGEGGAAELVVIGHRQELVIIC